jgi:hypothetical protein
MKKVFALFALLIFFCAAQAQTDRFMAAMQQKIAAYDTTFSVSGLTALANDFERIAAAEKNQWLPYYYAALAQVAGGTMMTGGNMAGGDASKTDPIADRAESLLNKAAALTPDNAELHVVRKMIANLRMMADPMNRYMTYGPQGAQALAKAKELDPQNPRVTLLEAQDKYYTPEQFGGSKEEAKKLFEETVKRLDAHKPQTAIHPHWGRPVAQYFLGQMNK